MGVALEGTRVVGVLIGKENYQARYASTVMRGGRAAFVHPLVPRQDAQASFQILRLSAASRKSFPLRNLPADVTQQIAGENDSMIK